MRRRRNHEWAEGGVGGVGGGRGGSKGFEFARGGEGRVYEAYEVKNKRQKLRCLLLRRKKEIFVFLFMHYMGKNS